jgi:autotransporter adhesin
VALDPSTAVGQDSSATGNDSEAYGYESGATGSDSEALGTGATVTDNNSVALGAGSTANTAPVGTSGITIRGQSYNFAGANPSGVVSVGSSGSTPETRLITNVAAGQISSTSTDAINGSELYATNQALDNLQATQGSTGVLHYTNASGATSDVPTATASAGNASTGPVTISNVGDGTIADGSTTAANGNDVWQAEQSAAATAASDANQAQGNAENYAGQVAASDANKAQGNAENYAGQVAASDAGKAQSNAEQKAAADANQAEQAANAHTNQVFTMTCHQTGNGSGDIVCGRDARVSGNNASAQGTGAQAYGNGANAYGAQTQALGDDATAIGNAASAHGYSTTAVGDHAEALAPNSTAVGENSVANGSDSVALGNGSVANRPNSVSVGNAATGLDRQITNVAAGTQPHDAVNLQQFDAGLQGAKGYAQSEADKVGSIDASLAAAGAEAAAGQHRNTVAGGTSDYNGQSSFAFAYQHRFGTHWAALMTVGSNGSASNTVIAGAASYSWR